MIELTKMKPSKPAKPKSAGKAAAGAVGKIDLGAVQLSESAARGKFAAFSMTDAEERAYLVAMGLDDSAIAVLVKGMQANLSY